MQLHWSSLVVLPNNARSDGGLFNGAARDSGHDQADQPEDVEKAVAVIVQHVQHVQQKCSQECSVVDSMVFNLNLKPD